MKITAIPHKVVGLVCVLTQQHIHHVMKQWYILLKTPHTTQVECRMTHNKGGKSTEKSVFLTLQTFPIFRKLKKLRLQTTEMPEFEF